MSKPDLKSGGWRRMEQTARLEIRRKINPVHPKNRVPAQSDLGNLPEAVKPTSRDEETFQKILEEVH